MKARRRERRKVEVRVILVWRPALCGLDELSVKPFGTCEQATNNFYLDYLIQLSFVYTHLVGCPAALSCFYWLLPSQLAATMLYCYCIMNQISAENLIDRLCTLKYYGVHVYLDPTWRYASRSSEIRYKFSFLFISFFPACSLL